MNNLEIIKQHIIQPYHQFRFTQFDTNNTITQWYNNFQTHDFQQSLSIIAPSVDARIQARRIAIGILLELVEQRRLRPPAYYLKKSEFTQYWSEYLRGQTKENDVQKQKGELYLQSNLLIFDGIDELQDSYERKAIVNFVEQTLDKGIPFIFISNRRLNQQFAEEYNIHNMVSKIREFSIETVLE